jgi:hypothetical protein
MAEEEGEVINGVNLDRFRSEPAYAQQAMMKLAATDMERIEAIESIEEQKEELAAFHDSHDKLFGLYQEFHGKEYGGDMKNSHGFCTCTNHYKPKISATMKLQHDIHSLNIGEVQKREDAEKKYASMMKLTILNPPLSSLQSKEEEVAVEEEDE